MTLIWHAQVAFGAAGIESSDYEIHVKAALILHWTLINKHQGSC